MTEKSEGEHLVKINLQIDDDTKKKNRTTPRTSCCTKIQTNKQKMKTYVFNIYPTRSARSFHFIEKIKWKYTPTKAKKSAADKRKRHVPKVNKTKAKHFLLFYYCNQFQLKLTVTTTFFHQKNGLLK
ncbi:hypothetical protein ACOSQ3_014923 [Xanthoceras sorbifolium]